MNDPRVIKQGVTLSRAGCRVFVVGSKLPAESLSAQRFDTSIVIVRTSTGFLARIRWLFRFRSNSADDRQRSGGGYQRLSRRYLALMLVSRVLLALKFAGLTLRVRPVVVHAHDFSTLPAAWLAAGILRVPLVYDAREVNVRREGYYRQLSWLILRIEGCLIRSCDRVIVTTAIRARHFRRIYRLSRTPVVLQNRPPLAEPVAPADLRQKLRIPGSALLCVYQGGLQEGRGLHNLISAIQIVHGVYLVLVGGGHQEAGLRSLAESSSARERIHFLGQVPFNELAPITAAADVGLQVLRNTCFNHWSTDSNKLFEYAAAGVAVVASDFPEIRRVVQRYEIGVLVDPDSVDSIAGAIRQLRDDRRLLSRFKHNAVRSAPHLCWETQAPALIGIYREIGAVP